VVFKAYYENKWYGVKVFNRKGPEIEKMFKGEKNLLKEIEYELGVLDSTKDCPYILNYHHYKKTTNYIMVFYELCHLGNL